MGVVRKILIIVVVLIALGHAEHGHCKPPPIRKCPIEGMIVNAQGLCECPSGTVPARDPRTKILQCLPWKNPKMPSVFVDGCPYSQQDTTSYTPCKDFCDKCQKNSESWVLDLTHLGLGAGADLWKMLVDEVFGKKNVPLTAVLMQCGINNLSTAESLLMDIKNAVDTGEYWKVLTKYEDWNNLAPLLCNLLSCLVPDAPPAVLGALCTAGTEAVKAVNCSALRLQCHTSITGANAIPHCTSLAKDPIWQGRPSQELTNAQIACCAAQALSVAPGCKLDKDPRELAYWKKTCETGDKGYWYDFDGNQHRLWECDKYEECLLYNAVLKKCYDTTNSIIGLLPPGSNPLQLSNR